MPVEALFGNVIANVRDPLAAQVTRIATRIHHSPELRQYFEELDRWHAALGTVGFGAWFATGCVATSSLVTAGYVHWASRSPTSLLGSMLTVPAWRFLDPEALLRMSTVERAETLESMVRSTQRKFSGLNARELSE